MLLVKKNKHTHLWQQPEPIHYLLVILYVGVCVTHTQTHTGTSATK